eukprot:Gb_41255 [translate_table: standard]
MDSVIHLQTQLPLASFSARNRNSNRNCRFDYVVTKRLKVRERCIVGKRWEARAVSKQEEWDVNDSARLYRVQAWGSPYFSINAHGNVCVRPLATSDGSDELDIVDLIESLQRLNVKLPMVIRFIDILFHRIQELQECFDTAIAKYDYQQPFHGVFPIKCNNDCFLIEHIVEFGRQFMFGLEAGSKPELLIAISKLCHIKDALLICNGYKDRIYIETALLARRLGIKVILVLEQMEELDLVIKISRTLGIQPIIGVRAKLSTRHNGHWAGTSGDNGKFGLSVNKLIQVVYRLREENMLHCLQLLHFHIGSQVPSISIIKEAMREGSHIYCELFMMGAPMHYIDVGGGLGIDYDGTRSPSNASTNYSMQNYANDVVAALRDACILKGVPQPVIVSESGRALASHHSVIVFDVLSVSQRTEPSFISPSRVQSSAVAEKADYSGMSVSDHSYKSATEDTHYGKCYSHIITSNDSDRIARQDVHSGEFQPVSVNCSNGNVRGVRYFDECYSRSIQLNRTDEDVQGDHDPGEYLLSTFYEVYQTMSEQNFKEAYNDAKQFKREGESLFKLGFFRLEHRAQLEALYDAISYRVLEYCKGSELPDELQNLKKSFAATYHINLSIFRSAPDSWAINQVFPVMPLHRLHEKPNTQATLADLTCDSDGKIEYFISPSGEVDSVLSVHHICEGEPYYMGLFLAGVYQEVMGSAHNLFGGTNVVHVRSKPLSNEAKIENSNHKGQYTFERVLRGQTMKDVLHSVRHNGSKMIEVLQREAEEAVSKGHLSTQEAETLLMNYKCSLDSYTYLTK